MYTIHVPHKYIYKRAYQLVPWTSHVLPGYYPKYYKQDMYPIEGATSFHKTLYVFLLDNKSTRSAIYRRPVNAKSAGKRSGIPSESGS